MRFVLRSALFALSLSLTAVPALAVPITYAGHLTPGVTSTGVSTQDDSGLYPVYSFDPEGADYWSLSLSVGARVNVSARRTATHFDPVVWVFFNPAGLYTDTDEFGGFLDAFTPGYVAVFDDEVEVPGPFGDPRGSFTALTTGTYTLVIASGISDAGMPDSYEIRADVVPEPATLVLFGTGLLVAIGVARGRRQRAQP